MKSHYRIIGSRAENLDRYGHYLQTHKPELYNSLLVVWDTAHAPAGNRPDRPQTLGTDDARDGESSRSNKGTENLCSDKLCQGYFGKRESTKTPT